MSYTNWTKKQIENGNLVEENEVTNIKTTQKVFKLFKFIATAIDRVDADSIAMDATMVTYMNCDYNVGGTNISLYVESDRFGEETEPGEPVLRFRINWPGTGAQNWETSLIFGDALAQCARRFSQCETVARQSGLTLEDFKVARETMKEIVGKVRPRLEFSEWDHVVKAALADLGL